MDLFLDLLRATIDGRPLPKDAAPGTVVFRTAGLVERAAVVELAATTCRASEAAPPARADLVVWTSSRQLDDLVRGAPVDGWRVDGDAALLKSLARMFEGGGSPLATRLAARSGR